MSFDAPGAVDACRTVCSGRALTAPARCMGLGLGLALFAISAVKAQPLHLPVAGDRALTHSQLVGALGEPPQAEVRPERLEPKPSPGGPVRSSGGSLFPELIVTGGELVLRYPALGLVATIEREDRPLADPPIRWLQMGAPEAAHASALRTPQGLFIGQPRQQALDYAGRTFRARASASGVPTVTFVAEEGRILAWMRPVYELHLTFDLEQRLSGVGYEFKPRLTRPGQWALAGAFLVAAALVAWVLQWVWQNKLGAPSLPVASAGTTRLVGRSILAAGGLIGVGSIGALGLAGYMAVTAGGNPYGGMGAYFLGMYAMVGLLGAAVLWVLGRRIEAGA